MMLHGKGSHKVVPTLHHQQQTRFDSRFSPEWRKQPRITSFRHSIRRYIAEFIRPRMIYEKEKVQELATIIEYELFMKATSEKEYINKDTLIQRITTQIYEYRKFIQRVNMVQSSRFLHAWSNNGTVVEPASQKLAGPSVLNCTPQLQLRPQYCSFGSVRNGIATAIAAETQPRPQPRPQPQPRFKTLAGPIINATIDRGAVAVKNTYGFPKGGLSHHRIMVSDMNESCVSCARRNLETRSKSTSSRFAQQHLDDMEMKDVIYLGTINRNVPIVPSLTAMEKWHQFESSKHSMQPYGPPEFQTSQQPQLPPRFNDYGQFTSDSLLPQPQLELESSVITDSIIRFDDVPFIGIFEDILPPTKRQKVEPAFGESSMDNASSGLWTHNKMAHCYSSEEISKLQQKAEVVECNVEGNSNPMLDSMDNSEFKSNIIDEILGQTFKCETVPSEGLEAILLDATMHTLSKDPIYADMGDIQGTNEFNHAMENAKNIDIELKVDEEKKTESSIAKVNHISEESDPNIIHDDVMANNNLKENVTGLNSTMHNLCNDPIIDADMEDIQGRNEFNHAGGNAKNKEIELKIDEEKKTESSNATVNHISEESDPNIHDVMANINLEENIIGLNSTMHTLCNDPIDADIEDMQGRYESGENAKKTDIEVKADQEKKTKSSTETINFVALTDFFTKNQLREYIDILKNQFSQSRTEEKGGSTADSCQLCKMQTLFFAPVPIYCSLCGYFIKPNVFYYHRETEELDTQHCVCTSCYKGAQGGDTKFKGTKTLLQRKRNDDQFEEPWVECNRCKFWQHQICALYNNKRDSDQSAEYICPGCRIKDIENGVHVPLPKTAYFGAKDLPRTMLSDHIEDRLFKRLMQERADKAKVEGNNNSDEILAAENLSVRVLLSVDKQLKVKKEFLDIFSEEDYPAEFRYRSKVIFLFQNIEEVDICLFAMYVQEFGSDCGLPNQRCVYISYLDSVKHFRPERKTLTGEALRTFVYHEILIGYLDFCKKRGFTTCYIYACPPSRGEDYLLYGKPGDQMIPKDAKLRSWYHTMLRKAAEENIVVGLTNLYDHFFVTTGKCDSKVTTARLPYFDGDNWCCAAMDLANKIEKMSGEEYERQLKNVLSRRALKAMGHPNPTKQTTKDILVMHKLGELISPQKEDFIIVHLQHACMHCHEVIVSGKRWFCTKCKNFQECERCHTADSHTSNDGKKHTLSQALIDDIPFDTKDNDIILDNEFLENRNNLLSFCHKNRFQFDKLRHAKYSTMMIIDHLKDSTVMNVRTPCSICCKQIISQQSLQSEICREFTICSACNKERGANCHEHRLTQASSAALSQSGNQELKQNSVLMQEMMEVLQHASRCRSTKTQPCSYKKCHQMKKLFYHAKRCTVRASGGCTHCKKTWMILKFHSKNCRDSKCCIPRCMDLKKHAQ